MKPQYNILHIVSTGRLSGAERVVQHICKGLNQKEFQPTIICTGEPLRKVYEQDGFHVEILNSMKPLPGNILRLRSIIKERKIHLIHAHGNRASVIAWLSTRFMGSVPIISHIHNTNPWLKSWNFLKITEVIFRNRYDLSIACSDTVRSYYLQNNPVSKFDKIIAITNGIEIKETSLVNRNVILSSLGISPGNYIFGNVGRLDEQKGIHFLLHAFKEVTECLNNVRLLIVGTGPYEHSLKKLTTELGLDKNVVFAGYRNDVYNMFSVMDSFIMSSKWEGLPMVLMEAMSQSLPVVASDVGGVRELVRNGETGFTVDAGDVSGLAEKMIQLYRDRDLAARMAGAGQNLVNESFNMGKQVHKFEEIYYQFLNQNNRQNNAATC